MPSLSPVATKVIAIDGPAASGKGTLARRLARHFGFAYLDTGALYRAVALAVLRGNGDPADPAQAEAAARSLAPDDPIFADPALRTDQTAHGASVVAALPGVRAALLAFQRAFAQAPPNGAPGAVLDGRDIATVVCPEAQAKLFVTACREVRALRRLKELQAAGIAATLSAVLEDMTARDERDSRRAVAPLRPAVDAFVLDTSEHDAEQAFQAALAFLRAQFGPA